MVELFLVFLFVLFCLNLQMDKECRYQVGGILCLGRVAGVEAVSGRALGAGAG